jgi:hypothetical protein
MIDTEPTITLPSGRRVLACISDLVATLQASGHTISLVADAAIVCTPAVHEHVAYLLDSNWRDVADCLEARGIDCWTRLKTDLVVALRPLFAKKPRTRAHRGIGGVRARHR